MIDDKLISSVNWQLALKKRRKTDEGEENSTGFPSSREISLLT
jgi:hypothetical protein